MIKFNMNLITGFEPLGIIGTILNRNESKVMAIKLNKEFKTDLIILPVKSNCINKLKYKLKKKYKLIFMLGQADSLRIETKTNKRISEFAELIKDRLNFQEENIGNYYCEKVYNEVLKNNKKVIFVHLPLYSDYKKIREIYSECLKNLK